jgi:DNA-binding NarL/FixJ family response regulator
MARVLLYSTVPIIAKGFAAVLSSVPEFDLVTVCSNAAQLPQTVSLTEPDMVVIDMDEETSFDRLLDLRHSMSSQTKVILWIYAISPELAYQAMRLGVRGILRKTLGTEFIVKCLQKVADGECWFEETLTSSFVNIRTVRLTKRESELISLISQGLKNKEIADALFIAEPTVKIYLSRLFRKVGAKDRFELALYGLRNMITGQINLFGGGPPCGERAQIIPPRRPPVLVVDDAPLRSGVGRLRTVAARSA